MQRLSKTCWSLADLLEDWVEVQTPDANTMITGLSLDSRVTKAGDLFFAIQGSQGHGLEFFQQAVTYGAAGIAWEEGNGIGQDQLPSSVPNVMIPALQQKVGYIARRFYCDPSSYVSVIGVTGTDGKTSVSQLIAQTFRQLKVPCGVVGTLGYGIYPELEPSSRTTPDAICIQALLNHFVEKKVSRVVIEASSHGLKQGRLNGTVVDTAVFTNLNRDHMDYHPSVEDYIDSKRILFRMPDLRHAVINIDDEFGYQLAHDLDKRVNVITYSHNNFCPRLGTYIYAREIRSTWKTTIVVLESSWGSATVETGLYGKFNVSNMLATIGALLASGYSFQDVAKAVSSVNAIPGRMETITDACDTPTVIIDYAHTPQALKNVLQALRDHSTGKLWCVFGCGGNRDPGKRELMARTVEEFADYAVVTDDNPRSEDPETITRDVIGGFSSSANYSLIPERRKAIKYAIYSAAREDTVLIAGKGHETVQIIKDEVIPFNDREVATAYLQDYRQ